MTRDQCTAVHLINGKAVRCQRTVENFSVVLIRDGQKRRVLSTLCQPCAQASANAAKAFKAGEPV